MFSLFHAELMLYEKDQILRLIRHFNKGKIGFDPARKSKSECAQWLLSLRGHQEIGTAILDLGLQKKQLPDIVLDTAEKAQTKRSGFEPEIDDWLSSIDSDIDKRSSQKIIEAAVAAKTQPVVVEKETAQMSAAPASSVEVSPADAGTQLASLIATLAGGAVNEEKVRKIVAEALAESPIVRHEIVRPDTSVHTLPPNSRPELVTAIKRAGIGLHLMLVGPAGSGKTYLAGQVAEALGRRFASISCTAGMSESKLEGWLVPEAGGAFAYLPSDFVQMYEEGGVFLFDEGDAADANTLLVVNQALSNGGFHLPQRKGNTYVKRHENFVCIMACNTYGTGANMQYAGRARLDEATLDRFRMGMIYVGYDAGLEKALADPQVLQWALRVRRGIDSAKLQRVMSTRAILDASKALRAGVMTMQEIQDTYFLGWKLEERAKIEG